MLPLFLTLLLQGPATDVPIPGNGSPRVTIPRIEASVQIDGVLDEAPWQQAARLGGFSQYQPSDGRPAEEQTEVLVWYSPTALHFGIVARDREPAAIRATVADRDNLDSEDSVTIYLDTFNDHRRAFFFTVNPLGIQQDGVLSESGFNAGSLKQDGGALRQAGGATDKNPDYQWDSKGRITEDGYVLTAGHVSGVPGRDRRGARRNREPWNVQSVQHVALCSNERPEPRNLAVVTEHATQHLDREAAVDAASARIMHHARRGDRELRRRRQSLVA